MDNQTRAAAARDALIGFSKAMGNTCEDDETQIVDLMADLFHLCDSYNININGVIRSARMHHVEEQL